ncbi:hypothetical protein [Okeania sp. SIO1I7]|uniref:hypothetical protein n=1 Tax=Okeania sp. SIO1I7 TaxID=2607772 RepID=UPI0013FC241F|nr:hypothetical protein [Okeania sp. SIO1I7]NET28098.1 hypothetical protein [Okeania sp. SIO1I7]
MTESSGVNPPLTPPRRGRTESGGKREGRRRTGVEGESFLSRSYPDMILVCGEV